MSAVSALIRKTCYAVVATQREAAKQSLLKAVFIACFILVLEAGLLSLFLSGFNFLGRVAIIIRPIFSFVFLGIGIMLVISSILTSYASMYRSAEVPFLLSRPFSISEVVSYKFLESCLLSSWAMFFIIAPFIAAYAWSEHLTPLFALWTLLFSAPFVILCCGIGTLVTMICVRWTPRGTLFKAVGVVFLAALFIGIWVAVHVSRRSENSEAVILGSMIPGLRMASHPAIPSWWISEGITCFADGMWGRGLLLLQMLTATALLIWVIVDAIGRMFYYQGWQKVQGADGSTRIGKPLLNWMNRFLAFAPHDVRAMVVKDARMLVRDPLQWSQFLVFFGLLGIYFASLRSFRYDLIDEQWRIMISFLNMFSMATVISSLAARFTYPQLSLEGHGFWMLGLSPTTMGRILMTKFVTSVASMSAISVTLMLISTHMLSVTMEMKVVAVGLAIAISVAVSALSTGLGAIFLDLRERNPAAIVSGFGGTLNIVLSLGFMLITVIPAAAVFYTQWAGQLQAAAFQRALWLVWGWIFIVTAIATVTPLVLGRRALMTREY